MTSMDDGLPPDWGSLHIDRTDLGAVEAFDQGGEGVLFRVPRLAGPHRQPLAFKEYRAASVSALDEDALERLALFARSLNRDTLAWLYQRAAWPGWIIDHDPVGGGRKHPVGVLMPLAPVRFMTPLYRSSGGERVVPAKFELLLNGRHFLQDVGIHVSPRQRIRLLGSVAETLAFLHAHSIAVGDFSCKNLFFGLRPEPSCFFIDCDSMWWSGKSALPPGETPEWELPPGEQLGTTTADVYKFALLALRMHTGAQHHRNPARLPDTTSGPLRDLIERTLGGLPAERPLITDWIGPLRAAAAAASSTEGPDLQVRARPGRPAAPGRAGAGPSVTVSMVAPAPVRPAPRDPASASGSGGPGALLPPWPGMDIAVRVLRRVLVRRSASPSMLKLVLMFLGLWAACALVFGLAVLAGMDPHHMSSLNEFALFGAFILLAVGAFALATTEPE